MMKIQRFSGLLILFIIASFTLEGAPRLDFKPLCGGVGTDKATFVFGMQFYGQTGRVIVSRTPDMTPPLHYSAGIEASEANAGIAKIQVTGLADDTRYFYTVEVDGEIALETPQSFRTFPSGMASFRFTFGNSLRQLRPNQNGMLASLVEEPLFFLNTGDLHYGDIESRKPYYFRDAYINVFNTKVHQRTMASVPLVFMFDDHDYGPNNSDMTAPGRTASLKAYRQVIPHYPLVNDRDDASIEQAFSVGRVRFILTDLRSNRYPNKYPDGPDKTMLGASQRAWFLEELKRSSETHALVFWVSTVPWIQDAKKGSDQWGGFAIERRFIADFIAEHDIRNLVILSGDAHNLSADDGRHSDYSTHGNMPPVPELIASPLDNDYPSRKGGPYSHGPYFTKKGENVYGLVEVTDSPDRVQVRFYGKNHLNEVIFEMEHMIHLKKSGP